MHVPGHCSEISLSAGAKKLKRARVSGCGRKLEKLACLGRRLTGTSRLQARMVSESWLARGLRRDSPATSGCVSSAAIARGWKEDCRRPGTATPRQGSVSVVLAALNRRVSMRLGCADSPGARGDAGTKPPPKLGSFRPLAPTHPRHAHTARNSARGLVCGCTILAGSFSAARLLRRSLPATAFLVRPLPPFCAS